MYKWRHKAERKRVGGEGTLLGRYSTKEYEERVLSNPHDLRFTKLIKEKSNVL